MKSTPQSRPSPVTGVLMMILGLLSSLTSLTPRASAELLSYDGFATDDYAEGPVAAQPYAGTGYVPGGAWNSNSTFELGGLGFPGLMTTPGYKLIRSDADVIGSLDSGAGGVFETAGLAGGGLIGGGAPATLYYSFLAAGQAGGAGFAGLNVYNGDTEHLGIGNANGPAEYSMYGGIPDTPLGAPPTVVDAASHLFVVKIEFGEAQDLVTSWLDPDVTMDEASQDPNIMATATHPDKYFDNLRMRGDVTWMFDEIRVGTTFEDVTPTLGPDDDPDGDGIPTGIEEENGLDPNVPDADSDNDGDGVPAIVEIYQLGTKANDPDSDDDLLSDGDEDNTGIFVDATHTGTSPTNPDTDNDGINDGDEILGDDAPGTNPVLADTDSDGFSDGFEVANGTDPLDPDDKPAPDELLSYEGFGADDYVAGSIGGQGYAGTGFAIGGSWPTNSELVEGGLSYPDLLTTDGFSLRRSDGDVVGQLDVAAGGTFDQAGLVSGGLIGGGVGTVYYSFLASGEPGGAGFAGLNVYNGDAEHLGIGNANGPAEYSMYGGVPDTLLGTFPTTVDAETHLFVAKIEFGAATDAVTVWFDPDPTLSEAAQDINIVTTGSHADTAFDNLRIRGDVVWGFDEIRFGTTFDGVTPTAIQPEFRITAVAYNSETSELTLTWDSRPGTNYMVTYSLDLSNWDGELDDSFPAADPGSETTATFNLNDAGIGGVSRAYFRIEIE